MTPMCVEFLQIRGGDADEVVELRHTVLRPTSPRDEAVYDGDNDPLTRHFVAVDESGAIVGCGTFFFAKWKRTGEPGWRLRGMAVRPDRQNRGIGGRLLANAEQSLRAKMANDPSAPRILWCQGRTSALRFYQRNGWTAVGEPFDVEPSGPHYVMFKRLDSSATPGSADDVDRRDSASNNM